MKIALLYAPPWKIPRAGQPAYPADGPPADFRPGDLDPDFHQTPYGLFTLGAQAMREGHSVKVLNLSGFAWAEIEAVARELDAEVFGFSCWTANRRGVALMAALVRRLHPSATIVVGGPHATPLAREMLEHHAAIDVVVCGEGEATFGELVGRVERGESLEGLAGAWVRTPEGASEGPPRASIAELDGLPSPHDYFDTHILMTSRGCPWQCTFCGAETSWGRGFRANSVEYVVDALESVLPRLPVRMIQIKDDTFTTNKKRVIELCRAMRARELGFLWSCDTRVDVLNQELLREMRLAGCERLSLGVESGSQRILDAIQKKIEVHEIVEATRMAKRVGIKVRFYMMLGNRGETHESFDETLAFLNEAAPHSYIFSCLSIYPGTIDYQDAVKSGLVRAEDYFSGDFQELKTPFDAPPELTRVLSEWFAAHRGVHEVYRASAAECRDILTQLGEEHPPAVLDLAEALYREQAYAEAIEQAERALELGHPTPGLVFNSIACSAYAAGDVERMKAAFLEGARVDPQHWVLIENVQRARRWFAERGPERAEPLILDARHDFALFERNLQPTLPGPLPEGWQAWVEPPAPRRAPARREPPEQSRTRLKVVSSP
ncbi:MAG: radical SAM protein [Polyangiaceae bacterium]|nr:radical SAM protein [Polyangiaceae bacterium]